MPVLPNNFASFPHQPIPSSSQSSHNHHHQQLQQQHHIPDANDFEDQEVPPPPQDYALLEIVLQREHNVGLGFSIAGGTNSIEASHEAAGGELSHIPPGSIYITYGKY